MSITTYVFMENLENISTFQLKKKQKKTPDLELCLACLVGDSMVLYICYRWDR